MGAQAPNLTAAPPPLLHREDEGKELFSDSVLANGARPARALPISLLAHGLVASVLILAPIFWPSDPEVPHTYQVVTFSPPPAAAAPLALGSATSRLEPQKPKPDTEPKKATPKPETPEFRVPQETKPLEKEASAPVPETAGSERGTAGGILEGMEGGVDGGVAGGVPNGVVGGVPGGTGAVGDYDQAPRLLSQAKPIYPSDGFVRKVEGTVVLEILIDATGRVSHARVVESIPTLDQAAIDCVYKWTFMPALKGGRPVPAIAVAPVRFGIL